MTDLELRLLHGESEPSEVALYDAADAFLAIGDDEMYQGLKYMGDNKKMPWKSNCGYSWWDDDTFADEYSVHAGYDDCVPFAFIGDENKTCHGIDSFAEAVRWLGKCLIERGMVSS